MTFTTVLILNAVLDVAILAALAFTMSRAAKLAPHIPQGVDRRQPRRSTRRPRKRSARWQLRPVLD